MKKDELHVFLRCMKEVIEYLNIYSDCSSEFAKKSLNGKSSKSRDKAFNELQYSVVSNNVIIMIINSLAPFMVMNKIQIAYNPVEDVYGLMYKGMPVEFTDLEGDEWLREMVGPDVNPDDFKSKSE